jgi:hypothetical protein
LCAADLDAEVGWVGIDDPVEAAVEGDPLGVAGGVADAGEPVGEGLGGVVFQRGGGDAVDLGVGRR